MSKLILQVIVVKKLVKEIFKRKIKWWDVERRNEHVAKEKNLNKILMVLITIF